MAAVSDPAGDIRAEEDRRRYFRDIGLDATQHRIRMLDRRARGIHRDRHRRPFTSQNGSMTERSSRGKMGTTASSMAGAGSSTPRSSAYADGAEDASGGASSSKARPDTCPATTHALFHEEMKSAREDLKERVQKFREEFVEMEWKQQWEVSLLQRPTSAELEDPTLKNFSKLRRQQHFDMCPRHQKVVVGRDTKEIDQIFASLSDEREDHNRNDGLKRSLTKMRENLFQRRLNLAIYEKTVGDWSIANLRAEARKKRTASRGEGGPGDRGTKASGRPGSRPGAVPMEKSLPPIGGAAASSVQPGRAESESPGGDA